MTRLREILILRTIINNIAFAVWFNNNATPDVRRSAAGAEIYDFPFYAL